MLEYMLAHEDLARGRVSGPDAARTKRVILEELSNILNAGDTKTPEKWLKVIVLFIVYYYLLHIN